jgi:hypothetical protein
MKCGPSHGNYQHGGYSQAPDVGEIHVALAKDLLRRIMTTPCDGRGELPFTAEEQSWALSVVRKRPDWAVETLRQLGFD